MNGQHCKRQQKSQVIAVGEWQKEEKVDQFLAVLTVVQPLSNHTTCCVVDFGLYVDDHETAETHPSSEDGFKKKKELDSLQRLLFDSGVNLQGKEPRWRMAVLFMYNNKNNSNNHTKRRRSHDPLIQIAYNDNQSNEQLLPNTTVVVACLCDVTTTKTTTVSRSTDSNCTQRPPIERATSPEHDDCCCMSLRWVLEEYEQQQSSQCYVLIHQ
ncbi:hypothetical protein BDB00DRAFT_880684 [Zychaea mexicana]|uniref:uncharacterized protein n=1 Tax=Zychaea mexicana TaxID=64656 RepID=UPI0022FDF60B|nr:uncharacterized protein BDB00DRAFT_880684 [Zychaea mexicana]KAI9466396.1 hypothetical protein BDB00DRAFT_880684 [Zychaea mexicana]